MIDILKIFDRSPYNLSIEIQIFKNHKISSEVLIFFSNRLKKYSHFLFKEYQTCSIPDRKINDSLNSKRDTIFESNIKGKELYLVSSDKKKSI